MNNLVRTENNSSFEYSYGNTEYVIAVLPVLMMAVSMPLITVNIIVLLAEIVDQKSSVSYWGHLFGLLISLAAVLLICIGTMNQYNKVRVTKGGLSIRVFSFLYRWIEVPWQDILGIELVNRPDRWMKTLWVIKVKKLTIWHRWLAFVFHTGNHPIILVSSDMENRESLLDLVRDKIEPEL